MLSYLISLFLPGLSTAATAQGAPVFATPALATDGETVTLLLKGGSGGGNTLSISGPQGSVASTYSYGYNPVTLTTPPLSAGLYEVSYTYYTPSTPPRTSLYSLQVFQKGGLAPTALQGQYTLQIGGRAANVETGPAAVGALASFTADGNGNITAGVLDLNTPAGVETGLAVTGSYKINAYGSGTISLVTPVGILPIVVQGNPLFSASLVQVSSGLTNAPAVSEFLESGSIATNAGGLASASGTLLQIQRPMNPFYPYPPSPPITSTLNGTYPASVVGERDVNGAALAGALQFQLTTAGVVTSTGTLAGNGTTFSYAGLTGTYTQFDQTTGRATLTLRDPNQESSLVQEYAIYQLPTGGFLFLTTNQRSEVGLLAGSAGSYY